MAVRHPQMLVQHDPRPVRTHRLAGQIATISARHCWVTVMRAAIWPGSLRPCSWRTRFALPFSAQPTIQPGRLACSAPSRPARIVASPTSSPAGYRAPAPGCALTGSTPRRSESRNRPAGPDRSANCRSARTGRCRRRYRGCHTRTGRDSSACAPRRCAGQSPDRPAPPKTAIAERSVVLFQASMLRVTVPLEDVLVGIGDHAGFERDDNSDLEGRGRQPASPERTLSLAMIR